MRIPTLSETLETVLNRCQKKVLIKRDSLIYNNNNLYYEFLWPDIHYINVKVCNKIQQDLQKRIEASCRYNPRKCKNIGKNIRYINRKLELLDDAEFIKELNIRDFLHKEEEVREKLREESIIKKSIHEGTFKETGDNERRFLKTLELYKLKTRIFQRFKTSNNWRT